MMIRIDWEISPGFKRILNLGFLPDRTSIIRILSFLNNPKNYYIMDKKLVGLHYDPKSLMELTDTIVDWLEEAELYKGIPVLEDYRKDIKNILECINLKAVDIQELLKDKN